MAIVRKIEAIVIGGSAGALEALTAILGALPASFEIPIALVVHVPPDKPSFLTAILGTKCALHVKEAEDKESMSAGTIYVAPPNYHLLVEKQRFFSLSADDPVLFSRPSIDVLFESAADAFGAGLAGVLLTGANEDGARGLAVIERMGGLTIVQEPATALVRTMPDAALRLGDAHRVLPPAEIGAFLARPPGSRGDWSAQ